MRGLMFCLVLVLSAVVMIQVQPLQHNNMLATTVVDSMESKSIISVSESPKKNNSYYNDDDDVFMYPEASKRRMLSRAQGTDTNRGASVDCPPGLFGTSGCLNSPQLNKNRVCVYSNREYPYCST